MSDVNRNVVPDKGSLNRERPVAKALQFASCTICFHLKWNGVCEKECLQRDTMTRMVAGTIKTKSTTTTEEKKEKKKEKKKKKKKKKKPRKQTTTTTTKQTTTNKQKNGKTKVAAYNPVLNW